MQNKSPLNKTKRLTLFVMHGDDDTDYKLANAWFKQWAAEVTIVNYETGGWEHLWDIEATPNAAASVPSGWLCDSEWSAPELFNKPDNLIKKAARFFHKKPAKNK